MSIIEAFHLVIPESALTDLSTRLRQTRWPERETVDDWMQGAPLEAVRELCGYWASDYDWRRCEARLNAFGQFRTTIDGLGIHWNEPAQGGHFAAFERPSLFIEEVRTGLAAALILHALGVDRETSSRPIAR